MAVTALKYGNFLRGIFLLLLLSLFLTGCVGGKQSMPVDVNAESAPADSLKAKFTLTIYGEDGKSQELDAVLFSVPNKRYRMELTGSLGIGVASLLWLEEGWQNNPSLPLVHIHQVAGIFEGNLLPENLEEISVRDSLYVDSIVQDSSIIKIHDARDPLTRRYTYAEKNGEVLWLATLGRDGKDEKLVIEEYKEFNGVKTPSKISFIRDETMFLENRVKKVQRGKPFGMGTWRLNIPRSYQLIGGIEK